MICSQRPNLVTGRILHHVFEFLEHGTCLTLCLYYVNPHLVSIVIYTEEDTTIASNGVRYNQLACCNYNGFSALKLAWAKIRLLVCLPIKHPSHNLFR